MILLAAAGWGTGATGAQAQIRSVALTREEQAAQQDPQRIAMAEQAKAAMQRKDYAEARRLFLLLAPTSPGGAQLSLGYLYETGSGGPRDLIRALQWYQSGATILERLTADQSTPQQVQLSQRNTLLSVRNAIQRVQGALQTEAAEAERVRQQRAQEEEKRQAVEREEKRQVAIRAERARLADLAAQQKRKFELADAAEKAQNYSEEMRILKEVTQQPLDVVGENGVPYAAAAHGVLGLMYLGGVGAARDFDKAEALLKTAVETGARNFQQTYERVHQFVENRRQVAPLAADISAMMASLPGFDDNAVLAYSNPDSSHVTIKLNGGVSFDTDSATLCVGVATASDGEAYQWTDSADLNDFVARALASSIGLQTIRQMSPRTKPCTLHTDAWDLYDVNKVGLLTHSPAELNWLKANLPRLKLVSTFTLADWRKDQEDRKAAAARAAAKAEEDRRKKEADAAAEVAKLVAARQAASSAILDGTGASRSLYFLTLDDPGASGVCFVQGGDRDKMVSVYTSTPSTSMDPIAQHVVDPRPLASLDAVFAALQHHQCRLAMGTSTEMKTLLDGWKQLTSEKPLTAIAVIIPPAAQGDLVRLADQKAEADRKLAAEAAQRAKAEEAARAQRQAEQVRDYPYRLTITCGNGYQLGICFMGQHDLNTTLEIQNGRNTDGYYHWTGWEVSNSEFARRGEMDLREHFKIKASNAASTGITLTVTITERTTGTTIFKKSASQFEWIVVQN